VYVFGSFHSISTRLPMTCDLNFTSFPEERFCRGLSGCQKWFLICRSRCCVFIVKVMSSKCPVQDA